MDLDVDVDSEPDSDSDIDADETESGDPESLLSLVDSESSDAVECELLSLSLSDAL